MKNGFRKRLFAGVLAATFCCIMNGNGMMAAAETVSAQGTSDQGKAAYDYMA